MNVSIWTGGVKSTRILLRLLRNFACGTTGCALGHAGVIPSFVRDGLKTEIDDQGGCVTFNGLGGFLAGQEFFDLTSDEADFLFDPGLYKEGRSGPKTVAKRIRSLIKEGAIPAKDRAEWGF